MHLLHRHKKGAVNVEELEDNDCNTEIDIDEYEQAKAKFSPPTHRVVGLDITFF